MFKKIKSKYNTSKMNRAKRKHDIKQINKFKENFRQIMFEKSIYDSFDRTITPINIELIENNGAKGIKCELDFPLGLSPSDLDRALDSLKENVYGSCMIILEKKEGKKMSFTAVNKWFNIDYKPEQTNNASEVFLGYDLSCSPAIVNLAKYPHLVVTGASGSGKILYTN